MLRAFIRRISRSVASCEIMRGWIEQTAPKGLSVDVYHASLDVHPDRRSETHQGHVLSARRRDDGPWRGTEAVACISSKIGRTIPSRSTERARISTRGFVCCPNLLPNQKNTQVMLLFWPVHSGRAVFPGAFPCSGASVRCATLTFAQLLGSCAR